LTLVSHLCCCFKDDKTGKEYNNVTKFMYLQFDVYEIAVVALQIIFFRNGNDV
jgi:hypothetical protein